MKEANVNYIFATLLQLIILTIGKQGLLIPNLQGWPNRRIYILVRRCSVFLLWH